MWQQLNNNSNTLNLNSNKYIFAGGDDFFEDSLTNNMKGGKQVVSTSTKTKISTVNGIKKTEVIKTLTYSDGTT